MADKNKSYLQIGREAIKASRESIAYETHIDTSTLQRYERNPANVPHDNMNILIDRLGDEYIGYLYMMSNDVAKRFIPEGVRKLTLPQAVLGLAIECRNLYEQVQDMMQLAADDNITQEEMDKWIKAKGNIYDFIKAFYEVECADGTEV